ncbi:MAG: hypothetical protein R6V49_01265 [Bacteroidales bacterium]
MKRSVLLLLLLITGLLAGAQTTIPNNGFEQWTGNKPTGWDASNFQISIFTIQTVSRDTVLPMEGTSNPLIQTKTFNLGIAQPTIPGIITLGQIIIDYTTYTGTVEGGIPFQGRPGKLSGFINAQPAAGDSAMIAIGFSKWNGVKRDTIGFGLAWFANPHNEWVAFEVPITFTDSQIPDSVNLIISSSAIGNAVVVAGSDLRVDSIVFDYGTVVVEQGFDEPLFTVWADQHKKIHYTLSEPAKGRAVIHIYQPGGALVQSWEINQQDVSGVINIGHLTSGVYLIGLSQDGKPSRAKRIFVR